MICKLLFFNASLAVGLFLLNSWLGQVQYGISGNPFEYGKFCFGSVEGENFSGNFFLKTINPAIYLSIAAAAIQGRLPDQYIDSLWMLLPAFWVLRFLYIIIKNRIIFLNLSYELSACVLSLLLGEGTFFLIIRPLLAEGERIWISTTEIRDAVWIAIMAYLVKTVWDIMKRNFQGAVLYPAAKIGRVINKRYDKFSSKYGTLIRDRIGNFSALSEEKAGPLICVVYAIMIYEDYNRPAVIRIFEYLMKCILPKRTMTLGIMQVASRKLISSKTSIKMAIDKIGQMFSEENEDPVSAAIQGYNSGGDYYSEVRAIYDELAQLLEYDYEHAGAEDADNESCMM